ncbi:ABC transporter ATP-binding protein [Halobaculum sp. MBLA0147]|uniref:ABC transporter ATP-binding protein n=1 Tax=Halobaculum sp. MBLA0147 TaxID=3079934 RepID=UPI00352396EE
MTLFETRELTKRFGGLTAVDEASVRVESGELVGLVGPNGAGKTTLFDCVTGFLEPTAGEVVFDGVDVTGDAPEAVAREGLVRTFQHSRPLGTLTVRENVMAAARGHPGESAVGALAQGESVRDRERVVRERADRLLERFDLDGLADAYAGRLSGGERKLLEIARSLMLDPELLMLDEPYAGISGETVAEVSAYIRELNDEGTTFVVIEHGLESLVELVDRLIVLNEGAVLADGPAEEVVRDERVVNVYTGQPIET